MFQLFKERGDNVLVTYEKQFHRIPACGCNLPDLDVTLVRLFWHDESWLDNGSSRFVYMTIDWETDGRWLLEH